MQKESNYPLGSFLNSSKTQLRKALEEGLASELGVPIEVHYRDILQNTELLKTYGSRQKIGQKGTSECHIAMHHRH